AYDLAAWSIGKHQFENGSQKLIPPTPRMPLDQTISFAKDGDSAHSVRFGWSGQEPTHRWTDRKQAGLTINLVAPPTRELELQFKLIPYLTNGIRSQNIKVSINGQQLTEWSVKSEGYYTVLVPSALVPQGRLDILFDISDPTSPCSIDASPDC